MSVTFLTNKDQENISGDIAKVAREISQLSVEIETLSNLVFKDEVKETDITSELLFNKKGYYHKETGAYVEDGTCPYGATELIEIDKLIVAYSVHLNALYQLAGVVFFNESKNMISSHVKVDGYDLVGISEAVMVPNNAKYVAFSSWTKSNVYIKAIKKVLITDVLLSKYEELSNKSVNLSDVIMSDDTIYIKLLGDSITQGSCSSGYIEYTVDGVTTRGNGPDYPNADENYKVGDYLGTSSGGIKWYESLNDSGWGQQLKAYFETKFNCIVKNYGMGGADTNDILIRLDDLLTEEDNIVFLMIGTNDRLSYSLETYYSKLNELVKEIIKRGKKLVLLSANPASNDWENVSWGNTNFHMEDVNNISKKVANENNIEFISLYNEIMNYCELTEKNIDSLLKDGLHPKNDLYTLMFKWILKHFDIAYKRDDATW